MKLKGGYMHKHGFTLAEILIAMAIIGVVAALTIPTLSEAYKKRVLTTQLQRAYAEVSQAGAAVVTEEMTDNFKYSQAIKDQTFLNKYLLIAGERDGFASSYGKYNDKNGTYNLREKMSNNKNDYKCGVTKSGAAICIDKNANGILDVNGENGPNLIGRDAYQITFDPDGTVSNIYIDYTKKNDWDIDELVNSNPNRYNVIFVGYGANHNFWYIVNQIENITGKNWEESEKLVNNAPVTIKENVTESQANAIKQTLEWSDYAIVKFELTNGPKKKN
ncbi:MAG: ribosomal protein L7/L12 [Clostridiales bacterium]|nr:ribosomal protein L7/L12 [bacterium]MBP5426516.1 ribosomal protein L7/L12 [Clostridiales bacterium]